MRKQDSQISLANEFKRSQAKLKKSNYYSQSLTNINANNAYRSKVETAILNSHEPIDINESNEICANGYKGIWANKDEIANWVGPVPLSEYPINQDPNPILIKKRSNKQFELQKKVLVRYLEPPRPRTPGEIIVKQEANRLPPPAPPIVIRQRPKKATTPEPLIIREAPPPPPPVVLPKIITIPGRTLKPPPRKVVIEKMAEEPTKPQVVILERWLPYKTVPRRIIYEKAEPSSKDSLGSHGIEKSSSSNASSNFTYKFKPVPVLSSPIYNPICNSNSYINQLSSYSSSDSSDTSIYSNPTNFQGFPVGFPMGYPIMNSNSGSYHNYF